MQKYCQNEPKLNGLYQRNNLYKTNDGAYAINLDQFKSIWNHSIAFYVNRNNITYFDSFGVEHIPKEIKNFVRKKNIITKIYRIQARDSIMFGYLCIRFIDFMLKGKKFVRLYKFIFSKQI